MKNENIVHVVEEYDIPRYEMRVRDDYVDSICDYDYNNLKEEAREKYGVEIK